MREVLGLVVPDYKRERLGENWNFEFGTFKRAAPYG